MTTGTNSQLLGAAGKISEVSDELLVIAISNGDRSAFSEFFLRYSGRVRGFLIKIGARHGDADELSQEVMVTVWRKAHMFDPERAKVSTWLFTIARNRWIDTLRRHARPEPDPHDPMFQAAPEPDGVTHLSAIERETQVRAAISGLPTEQREVLIAGFFKGLSQSEIAEEMNVPIGTVKSRTRLAFAKLKGVLSERLIEELKYD